MDEFQFRVFLTSDFFLTCSSLTLTCGVHALAIPLIRRAHGADGGGLTLAPVHCRPRVFVYARHRHLLALRRGRVSCQGNQDLVGYGGTVVGFPNNTAMYQLQVSMAVVSIRQLFSVVHEYGRSQRRRAGRFPRHPNILRPISGRLQYNNSLM